MVTVKNVNIFNWEGAPYCVLVFYTEHISLETNGKCQECQYLQLGRCPYFVLIRDLEAGDRLKWNLNFLSRSSKHNAAKILTKRIDANRFELFKKNIVYVCTVLINMTILLV